MPDEDSRAEDWRTLWKAAPEDARELLRTRWGKEQSIPNPREVDDWRFLWAVAPHEVKEEMRVRWNDERIFPFGANRPLSATELREIIEEQKESVSRWVGRLALVLIAVYLLIHLIEYLRR